VCQLWSYTDGRETAIRVLDTHFATGVDGFRSEDKDTAARSQDLRRFSYNPLRGRPVPALFRRLIAVSGQTEGISGSSISFSVVDSTS
jgi:hypothetical protein